MEQTWDKIIKPEKSFFYFNVNEIWDYRDLIGMYVKRDFVTFYKQTILGPLWFFIQPFFTSLIYVFVFSGVAGISTDGIPPLLFYLSGIALWNYFSECLNRTALTFKENQNIFGKVYFPRIVVPISIVISNLLKLVIQLGILILFYLYYKFTGSDFTSSVHILVFPLLIFLIAFLGLGFGLVVSALTTKYRDLIFLLQFGIQLWMFATPVIYPLDSISESKRFWIELNPLSSIIEAFRYGLFNKGIFDTGGLIYSTIFALVLLIAGILIFNKTEKSFIDTI